MIRQPWPWEDAEVPVGAATHPSAYVALPDAAAPSGHAAPGAGELDTRSTLDRIRGELRGMGVSDADAARLSRQAAVHYEAGVRAGAITTYRS